MPVGNLHVGNYKNLAASSNVNPKDGCMLGFYVNSTSTGVIQFYDSATTTTTTAITGPITPALGWNAIPVTYTAGLYMNLNSGSINVTVSWC